MILRYLLKGIYFLFQGYSAIIFISIILTWIPSIYNYKFPRLIRKISDWYMWPFRGILVLGFLDFTPIIGIMLLETIVSLFGMWVL